jgi:hypothetical protein
MNTSLRHFAVGLVVALDVAGIACSSSMPLKKPNDAAVARDLGADQQPPRDAPADVAGPDLAEPDLPVLATPDARLAGKDTALSDVLASKDTPVGDLSVAIDLFATDLAAMGADASVNDARAVDVSLPADLGTGDGPADVTFGCTPSSLWPGCNDTVNSEAIMGKCQPNGTCMCNSGYVINLSTGRCMYPRLDASVGGEAGPVAVCSGDYTACGCGCCGGGPSTTMCYYPSLGETIAAITAQDKVTGASPDCAGAGCGIGIHYVCCVPPAPNPPSSATYSATGYSGGKNHVTISKSGADCATLSFDWPTISSSSDLRVATPSAWGLSSGQLGTCGDASAMDLAKGAVGTFALRSSNGACLTDVHASLFTFTATGEVKAVRFDADGLTVAGLPVSLCR